MRTLRARTTVAAAATVGLALVIASVGLLLVVRRSLTMDVRAAAELRAAAVANAVGSNRLTDVVESGDREKEFIQLLAADGTVLASSENVSGRAALAWPGPGTATPLPSVPFEDGTFLAVSAPAGEGIVVVGRAMEPVEEAIGAVGWSLAAGIPLLLSFVGAVAWRLVGRALDPVEAIRAEVEAISSSELHRRVPVPASEDELARLAGTMNRMLARLEEAQATLRRFVSDASHELRSPIASIRQHVEVAMEHPRTTDVHELADVVSRETLRLQRIVDDLLLLSGIDEGTLPMRTADVRLDRLIAAEADRLRGAGSIDVQEANLSATAVRGDREHLDRLLRNLTDNAARHAASTISLSLAPVNGALVLTIDDDGDGIRDEDRERVFGRFVRLDEARDRGSGGTGLGLAIVHEIAVAHSATVRVTDSPLGGARFEVAFPIPSDSGSARSAVSGPARESGRAG